MSQDRDKEQPGAGALVRQGGGAVALMEPPAGGEDFAQTTERLKGAAREVPLKQRKGGSARGGRDFFFDYMSGEQVMDLLDEEVPDWQFRLSQPLAFRETPSGLCITAVGSLTIGGITREGVGVGIQQQSCPLETAIKKADTDSLKRAAAKFGVGVARIKAEAAVSYEAEGRQTGGGGGQRQQRVNPRAQTEADKATEQQKTRIGDLCRELQHGRTWLEENIGCKAEDMSKAAANTLINVLEREAAAQRGAAEQAGQA